MNKKPDLKAAGEMAKTFVRNILLVGVVAGFVTIAFSTGAMGVGDPVQTNPEIATQFQATAQAIQLAEMGADAVRNAHTKDAVANIVPVLALAGGVAFIVIVLRIIWQWHSTSLEVFRLNRLPIDDDQDGYDDISGREIDPNSPVMRGYDQRREPQPMRHEDTAGSKLTQLLQVSGETLGFDQGTLLSHRKAGMSGADWDRAVTLLKDFDLVETSRNGTVLTNNRTIDDVWTALSNQGTS